MAKKAQVSVKELKKNFSDMSGQYPFELLTRLTFASIFHKPEFCFEWISLFSKKWEIFTKQKNKELVHEKKIERIGSFEDYLKYFSSEMHSRWMKTKRKRKTSIS